MAHLAEGEIALPRIARIEWPTVALAALIYGGFGCLTYFWRDIPIWILVPLGAWLIAWHGSLQHEVIHNHPTRHVWLNDAIGVPPISLWLPYHVYKESHLAHHRDEHLTDPIEDPESYYFTARDWDRFGWFGRTLREFNLTLAGRLTVGPAIILGSFLWHEAIKVIRGEGDSRRLWAGHAIGVAAVLWWVLVICEMPFLLFFFGFVYCGTALSRLRSYAEHRFADNHEERTAIVERSPLFGLLFLYNNLHVLHHRVPGLPWYMLPRFYERHRDFLVRLNGGLVYRGYVDVARRFLFRKHDRPTHPRHS
ncbi:MAG: fatty acid desaturase [Pseudomonadota bacterium]|nr:fatty acid desaturase [Pseudomonadota bacterium]